MTDKDIQISKLWQAYDEWHRAWLTQHGDLTKEELIVSNTLMEFLVNSDVASK